jgi:hypothetical protein
MYTQTHVRGVRPFFSGEVMTREVFDASSETTQYVLEFV